MRAELGSRQDCAEHRVAKSVEIIRFVVMVSLLCLVQEDNIQVHVEEQPPSWAQRVLARQQDQPMVSEDQAITVQQAGMTRRPLLHGAQYVMGVQWVLLVVMLLAPHVTILIHVLVYALVMG